MTVVSAMVFNSFEGAIVSDEQGSNDTRLWNLQEKIHILSYGNMNILVGQTGNNSVLQKAIARARTEYESITSLKEVSDCVQAALVCEVREQIGSWLGLNYGITEADVLSLKQKRSDGTTTELSKEVWTAYRSFVEKEDSLKNRFIVLGAGNDEPLNMYVTGVQNGVLNSLACVCNPRSMPYLTVGSGADTADPILYAYVSKLSRNARENIPPAEGLMALLTATEEASQRNRGVGGLPHIGIVRKSCVQLVNEKAVHAARLITFAANAGFIKREDASDRVCGLIWEKINPNDAKRWLYSTEGIGIRSSEFIDYLTGLKPEEAQ